MKRVEISPGRYVCVPMEMAQRAARIFASGTFTADQVREAALEEGRHPVNAIIGGMATGAPGGGNVGSNRRHR